MLLEWADEPLSKMWSVLVMGGVVDTSDTVFTSRAPTVLKNVDKSCNK